MNKKKERLKNKTRVSLIFELGPPCQLHSEDTEKKVVFNLLIGSFFCREDAKQQRRRCQARDHRGQND